MTFYTEFDPENWLEKGSNGTFQGFSTETQEDVDLDEEFGEDHHFQGYEIETDIKENNTDETLLEGDGENLELEENGFLYDVEIRETVDLTRGKAARKEMDGGLLSVHFTGCRDGNGNDYIVHSDPKKWVEEGKEKYPDDEGKPDVEEGLQKTEDFFSEEGNYIMDEGLSEIESYLSDIAEREDGALSYRWEGLRDAVSAFRQSIGTGKPVNIDR